MNRKHIVAITVCAPLLLANEGGCDPKADTPSAVQQEQEITERSQDQLMRNQPIPTFDWSLERHLLIQLYGARQRATATFSFVQSEYTGKVLWSCPSLGFPLPYATQLTNSVQPIWDHDIHGTAGVTVALPEPNGLYPPASAEGTWVMCVDAKGRITPRYEERRVTVTVTPMTEKDGQLVVQDGAEPTLTLDRK